MMLPSPYPTANLLPSAEKTAAFAGLLRTSVRTGMALAGSVIWLMVRKHTPGVGLVYRTGRQRPKPGRGEFLQGAGHGKRM